MSGFVNPWSDFSTEFENTTDKTHNTPVEPSETAQTSTDKTELGEGFVTDKTPYSDLLARAEALITLYGPLKVDSGVNGCATDVLEPEMLVRLYLKWPWGIIGTQNRVAVMQWGTPPEHAYEGWTL